MTDHDLFCFRRNVYSQYGEDGIIERILELIGLNSGMFVEFGAWNGKYLSNTYLLFERGWSGCYFEGATERHAELCRNIPAANVLKIHAFVTPDGENSLDNLLIRHGIDAVDLLSIDIDSDDLAVWKSLSRVSPKIVVIEFNPLIPFDTRYINPPGENHGNSALSLKELADEKGYIIVEGLACNLIFVRRDVATAAGFREKGLQAIRDQNDLSRFFFGFDGTLVKHPSRLRAAGISELHVLPWGNGIIQQPLPKIFRFYVDRLTTRAMLRFAVCALLTGLRSPLQFIRLYLFWRRSRFVAAEKKGCAVSVGDRRQ